MRHRVVCQVVLLLLVAALRTARGEGTKAEPDDTAPNGSGSFALVSTGVAASTATQQARPERAGAIGRGSQIKSKAQYTRTALHVARSLDPDATETMQVRTRTGDVATLIVKRRSRTRTAAAADGSPPQPTHPAAANSTASLAKRVAKASSASTAGIRVPDPVDIRSSTVLVKAAANGAEGNKRARSLTKVDADGIPVIEGVRVPDDEDDKKYTWRNARVINGVLVPNNATVAARHSNTTAGIAGGAQRGPPPPHPQGFPASLDDAAVKRLAESTAQSPWIPTSPDGANVVVAPLLTPQLHGVQSRAEQQRRILEYIRAVNQLEAGRVVSAASGARGRMLRNTEATAEARVLHYQPALLYSAQSTNPARVVSFEEGVRTPVLQYAHPELGVQPAKVAPPAPAPTASAARTQDRALAYFGQDIHADRSPFAREPGLDHPEEPVKPMSAKRSSSDPVTASTVSGLPSLPNRPKKVQPLEDSYGLASDKYIKRFPHATSYKDYRDYKDDYSVGYGYGHRYNSYTSYNPQYAYSALHSPLEDPRPFWVRLSDSIQTSMRSGMERMSDLARPVVDPLVEASAKISHNLGFTASASGATRGAQGAQDRLGSVGAAVASPSMLLPALGLVAGGAALGLGAVAVGRYLDVDVMAKRSEAGVEDDEDLLEMEHKRMLHAQQRYLAGEASTVDGRQVNDADVVAQVVDVVNKEKQQQEQQYQPQEPQAQQGPPPPHARRRRDSSANANTLDAAELAEERRQLALRAAQLGAPTAVWGSTPCAQRVFCDVLAREGVDSALLMEKKMATLLAMLPRVAPEAAAIHLSAVMSAVRRGDCSQFVCPINASPGEPGPSPGPRR